MSESKPTTNVEHVDVSIQLTRDEQIGEQLFEAERQYGIWQSAVYHKRIILHSVAAFGAGIFLFHKKLDSRIYTNIH
jgi:hypothetical protein